MALTALLFAHHGAGADGEPHAARRIAGTTLIERQVLQARRHGATGVRVVVERMPPRLAAALLRADVEVVRTGVGFSVEPDESVLVIADALEVNDALVAATLAKAEPALAVWKGKAAHEGAERIDANTHWAGVAVYPGAMVAATLSDLGEWDLQATLLRSAVGMERPSRVDAGAVGGTWQAVRSEDDASRLTALALEAGRPAHPDVVTRLLQPLHAQVMARLVEARAGSRLPWIAALAIGAVAVVAFAAGWRWPGLLAAIVAAALTPLGGELARLWHDPVPPAWPAFALEVGWYGALALSFAGEQGAVAAAALALLIVMGRGGTSIGQAVFRRLSGSLLAESGPIGRWIAMAGATRNTLLWLLLPFAALGAWWAGFVVLGLYATLTHGLVLWRLYGRSHR